jgi:UDP-N-acetylglucosamine--N-acetylmuramyl-(pentapeptide) pyrophosphoryl-undecaprenol N-acetylglucosamine transferase
VRVAIAGGGTAGHVNPALALAEALAGCEVTFLGTATGAEARLVPAAGWPLEAIEVRGWDRARPASFPAAGAVAVRALASARRVLRRIRPDVVVGMGGYVSLPACLAARSLGKPIVLHEQNIVLGLANRVCKPLASAVAVSFRDSLDSAGRRGVFVGNPIRAEIANADHASERARGLRRFSLEEDRHTLLVFGGSQGARRINDAVTELRALWAQRGDLQVVHVTGSAHAPSREQGPGLVYRAVPFVDRMIEAYAVADVALCRGGATTVAELEAVGLPSIIVPYPFHRDRQQELHARVLERAGAAIAIPDADASGRTVAGHAERLLGDTDVRARMRSAAVGLATPDAAERLAGITKDASARPLRSGRARIARRLRSGRARIARRLRSGRTARRPAVRPSLHRARRKGPGP